VQTPFGITYSETSAPARATNIRFPGQWADAETGLNYNYFRDYDPTLGRYIESDPIGLGGGLNTFGYVGANPVGYFDRWGLDETDWVNRAGDRGIFDGPTNGNWGGQCWSGGQYSCGDNVPGNAPPLDSGDECYQRHDNCYVSCGGDQECMEACDATLVGELNALPPRSRDWANPPRPGTEEDSEDYRDHAIDWFEE
jgi:RHS repeat-associated protein